MKKNLLLIIIIVAIVSVIFYPKDVGRPLCGPICPGVGLHYYEIPCIGFEARYNVIDFYWDVCYGLSYGEKKCYGVPYTEWNNWEKIGTRELNTQLDCDYPCNDPEIKSMCQTQENLNFGIVILNCNTTKEKCGW